MSFTRIAGVAVAFALVVSGCRCRPDSDIQTRNGDLGVIYEVDGVAKTDRDAIYDFGSVFMGQEQKLKLRVTNGGLGALDLERLEKEAGDAVAISGGVVEPAPVFDIQFSPSPVGPAEVVEFEMTFRAPQNDVEKIVDHSVTLVLRAANAEAGKDTAIITLKGKAVSGVCELPKVIDFGSVAKGDTLKQEFPLKNPTQLPATASVGEIYGGDALSFAFEPESAKGTVSIAPNTEKKVVIGFSPTESRSYLAFFKARAAEQCPELAITVKGVGVDSVLTWAPNPVDFGYVTPGIEITQELTFTNAGLLDVQLSQIKTLAPAEFKVVVATGADPTTLTVAGRGGTAKLVLSFKPTVLGPRTSQLTFSTTLARQATGAVGLKGFGGGPDINVVPSPTLNFGKVAYFSGASSFQTRKLTVMNVGTRPAIPDPNANLKLLPNGAGGNYWDIVPLNSDSAPSEIEILPLPVSGANSYNPSLGLEASAGKNLVDLVVKVTPSNATQAGISKQWEVTIYSNDPDEAAVKITVTADAVLLPPCNYSVSPTALNFGLVTPPSYRDLTFTIKNLGQNAGETCLLSNLDVAAGTDPVYSLPAGTVASRELQPQESMVVTVRAWPQGQVPAAITNATGQVEFFMSSPTQPQKLVSLTSAIANGCLTIAPNDLDFGTVQRGCNSLTKTFSIYNTCTSPVTINSFAMQAAAGQPAGGPNCASALPCPEFMLVSTPAIPTGGLTVNPGATPTTFTAKYAPIDLGSDSGAIAINAVQAGQNVTYIVTLQGKGDTIGLNTDVFTQDAKPKADILLTIDNSCSMSDEQQALANNFASFIQFAVSANVDYHIGVIATDNYTNAGKLMTGASHPEKILSPTTPDVQNKFKAKVNLGINGSASEMCFEPALKALSAPLITADNAGFLRNDAALAIVCITDELEQSPQPVTYYLNQFLNIKGIKRANMFTVNAIAGFFTSAPSGCNAYADDGRYASMVTQTNGVKESICTPDWSKSLEQLGKTAFGFRTNFFLNAVPDLTGGKVIVVKINGVDMPQVDSRGQAVWTYDSVANSVNFEPMFVPEPGDTLTITYYVSCY
ncbi:MAG: choice-of-anchor D domain-containing protein [Myxococcota bacterium]